MGVATSLRERGFCRGADFDVRRDGFAGALDGGCILAWARTAVAERRGYEETGTGTIVFFEDGNITLVVVPSCMVAYSLGLGYLGKHIHPKHAAFFKPSSTTFGYILQL